MAFCRLFSQDGAGHLIMSSEKETCVRLFLRVMFMWFTVYSGAITHYMQLTNGDMKDG